MASPKNDNSEPSVDPGAFWHTNMDLYYGYIPGEVVEIEHEPNKYWLASIKYCFKHLVLLEWVGKYGEEFWVDTSMSNSLTTSGGTPGSHSGLKRLFPLGYHLGAQLKSKFKLEKPSKILNKPSLYNPSKDPYADIRTIEELLVHEIDDRNNDDAFAIKSTCDTASLALAKCKTKFDFGQEDQDELEAALLSLSGLEQHDESKAQTETSDMDQSDKATNLLGLSESTSEPVESGNKVLNDQKSIGLISEPNKHDRMPTSPKISTIDVSQVKTHDSSVYKDSNEVHSSQQSLASPKDAADHISDLNGDAPNGRSSASRSRSGRAYQPTSQPDIDDTSNEESDYETFPIKGYPNPLSQLHIDDNEKELDEKELDKRRLKLCKRLQVCATNRGRYRGVDSSSIRFSNQVFFCKPKQLYDVGGANHERLFVPGTLIEVCHTFEEESGLLEPRMWFAYVVKNVGGRLTLRWLLYDEPKFKQGRLELRSSKCNLLTGSSYDNTEASNSSEGDSNKLPESLESDNYSILFQKQTGIPLESITFSLHFCDPKIYSIFSNESYMSEMPDRIYSIPQKVATFISEKTCQAFVEDYENKIYDIVFDTRRINLDKDRPLIDHVLTVARQSAPKYLDLVYATEDRYSKREVLISCPKMSKLLKATVRRQWQHWKCRGIFEIHSEPLPETGEIIKFIHPFESSYTILPLDWAENHEECISVDPSRNPSPSVPVESSQAENESKIKSTSNEISYSAENQREIDYARFKKYFQREGNPGGESCLNPDRFDLTPSGGVWNHPLSLGRVFCHTQWKKNYDEAFDEFDPFNMIMFIDFFESYAPSFHFCIDSRSKEEVERRFKVMDLIEVVHPSSDRTICLGRIRKVLFPLIWIQLSTDSYTLLPYDSTNIYPHGWCEAHNHKLISLLPPRKRCIPQASSQCNGDSKRRKKARVSQEHTAKDHLQDPSLSPPDETYEKEHFDLASIKDRQADIDNILSGKSAYIEIFFNHKCFTGPSLSKSKICSLPQYVGPGPMRLVIEEVVTKVISVAYVPPRILNDLSSKSFEELLIERNLTNTIPIEFKAKYQKRVHRDTIPVCVSSDDVALYCECICEHIKCCYNLFGLKLYDGDDCPSHCRSLTKSNKFMKRATYYREKARQGEFLNQNNNDNNGTSKKASNSSNVDNEPNSRTASRARYTGRGSSESTCSSNLSCSDQTISRSSPAVSQNIASSNEMKENSIIPEAWTVEDVARYLDSCQLGIFKNYMKSEGIDGQALLLIDKATIEEHLQYQMKSEFTQEEVNRLCHVIELIKTSI